MGSDPASSTASLAPGFRFHPTDEELVRYYLKRKVCRKPFRFEAISDIDVYKSEPWDLPGKSRLKSRDLEWYFFSVLDKKYGNGSRTNRATGRGYWKTTGKDRPVHHKSRTVGMKKTLVYHSGRAPRGDRTNWVMHEYRLVDEELEKAGIAQDSFVLCRIFQKSGSGPKNGEQYGAPFIEEEWEDDELVMIPGEEAADEVAVHDDAYRDGIDLEQILDADIPLEHVPLPLSFNYEDNSSHVQKPVDFVDHAQKLLVGMGESYCVPEQPDGQNLFDLPVQKDMDAESVKHENIGEASYSVNAVDEDYLLDEPFFDATGNTLFDDGGAMFTNDLSNPIEADPSGFDMVEEYLKYFDADDSNLQFVDSDSLKMMGSENLVSDQAFLTQKHVNGGAQEENMGSQQLLQGQDNDFASTSKQNPGNFGSDIQHPFMKQASRMLGSIPAPPAFASEFPAKDVAFQLNSASQSSSEVHFTAGMIQLRNMTLSQGYWSLGKHTDVNMILTFGPPHNDSTSASSDRMANMPLGKAGSSMSRCWFYLMFAWILIISMSFKIGAYIYTGNA
ncbi:NAC domain-containing protein 78-like [Camellia sinensis]|uniref:NAC domain-containing protein 78-like n=1 Tax=Camellia sinensis TaxID=4442 RepID=UPI001035FD8D|nr:NAC domain-containing protein 78-like [Camellia sinensis]